MKEDTGYGPRLAQTRRLLSAVLNADVTQAVAGQLIDAGSGTWSRWETEEMRPRRAMFEKIAAVCAKAGLPFITAAWLDYGEGAGPPSFAVGPVSIVLPQAEGKPVARKPRVPSKPAVKHVGKVANPKDERIRHVNPRKRGS